MAAGTWTIVELRNDGRGQGETFTWTTDLRPPTPKGGARSAPKAPWSFGGTQRHVRTDYPSATTPSVQILGAQAKPFTIEGRFDDRFNFAGYAAAEMRRLEDMCKRGNLCRLQFQDQTFLGLFTDWTFPYQRDWQIGYTLTFDVHERPENYDLSGRSPKTDSSPATVFDSVDLAAQKALDSMTTAPRMHLVGSTVNDVEGSLALMASAVDQLGATMDNSEITPSDNPVDGYTRMATQFREVRGRAYDVLLGLAAVRSDTELAVQTALGVLNFEDWSRSVRYAVRLAMGQAVVGDRACTTRAEPDAIRLYRPQQGESLYRISQKFYGTPFAWRLIYQRNQLSSVTLTGDEILIIPERGQA